MSAGEGLSVADVLSRAADLIEPEGAWTQGVQARTHDGLECGPLDRRATCWCVEGALDRVAGRGPKTSAYSALRQSLSTDFVYKWNDAPERTQAEVVAKLRGAAELAREQGL